MFCLIYFQAVSGFPICNSNYSGGLVVEGSNESGWVGFVYFFFRIKGHLECNSHSRQWVLDLVGKCGIEGGDGG